MSTSIGHIIHPRSGSPLSVVGNDKVRSTTTTTTTGGGGILSFKDRVSRFMDGHTTIDLASPLVLVFAIMEILVIVLFETQHLLPSFVLGLFPRFLNYGLESYCYHSLDPFLCKPTLWMQAFLYADLLFQLPLLSGMIRRHILGTIHSPSHLLILHALGIYNLTKDAPILMEIFYNPLITAKMTLACIYAPLAAVALLMTIYSAVHLLYPEGIGLPSDPGTLEERIFRGPKSAIKKEMRL